MPSEPKHKKFQRKQFCQHSISPKAIICGRCLPPVQEYGITAEMVHTIRNGSTRLLMTRLPMQRILVTTVVPVLRNRGGMDGQAPLKVGTMKAIINMLFHVSTFRDKKKLRSGMGVPAIKVSTRQNSKICGIFARPTGTQHCCLCVMHCKQRIYI